MGKTITTTIVEEYENGVIVKKTTTTWEENSLYSEPTIFPTYPIYPSYPTYPWQSPIIYGTGTGNPIPNYVDVTCQVEGQINLLDW